MRFHCFVLFLSLSAFTFTAVRSEARVGGWKPIQNIADPHVTEIANYAVTEYDNRSGSKLKLVKVIKGETQVVAGTNYRLVLAAKDESATKHYEAVVWEKVWEHFKNLTSFKPLN
ncbi:cysteine proteinase inhibitor 5-like [Gastrolobium bilobum]|uniref:cysteine proteinase inhibitor 5-like n=1 Tax=Gastrolobium bilobum TaxID=150636 RepID=UPI002AAF115F|nr:cysteine proteinase inhibitor 5-like [Gastrolobium bilobum]